MLISHVGFTRNTSLVAVVVPLEFDALSLTVCGPNSSPLADFDPLQATDPKSTPSYSSEHDVAFDVVHVAVNVVDLNPDSVDMEIDAVGRDGDGDETANDAWQSRVPPAEFVARSLTVCVPTD